MHPNSAKSLDPPVIAALEQIRVARRLRLTALAREIGIQPATLRRALAGRRVWIVDVQRVQNWLAAQAYTVWCDAPDCRFDLEADSKEAASAMAAEHEQLGAPHRCFIRPKERKS